MKKIILVCDGGMSTGLLVNKLREMAQNWGKEYDITACDEKEVNEAVAGADAILLAPNIDSTEEEIKEKYPDIPVLAIDMHSFGMVDGEGILKAAIKLIEG